MQCENELCIYWEKNECILNEITLDVMGMCQQCVYVNIDKKTLEKEREKTRRSLGD